MDNLSELDDQFEEIASMLVAMRYYSTIVLPWLSRRKTLDEMIPTADRNQSRADFMYRLQMSGPIEISAVLIC